MGNKIKGVIDLDFEGKSYPMTLDFNALADFEDETGVESAIGFVSDEKNLNNATMLRKLFWCGLKQAEPDMSLQLAGKILSANLDKLGSVLSAAFPDADEADAGNVPTARLSQHRGKRRRR